jgi:hypothetical protein
MDGDYGLSNLRFEGYSNEDLARQVDELRNGGVGPETMNNAVRALVSIAEGLAETDRTLREQLREIGVTWQGTAAEDATQATQAASIYAEDATNPVIDSAKGVSEQHDVFTTTRNSAPESSTLRGPSQENFGDKVAGFFGHTTDHAKDVRATNQARDQAVDGLNGYQAGSSDALNQAQGLPVPPGMNLVARPAEVDYGVTGTSGLSDGSGTGPNGLPGPGGGGGNPNFPTTGPGPGPGQGNPLPTTGVPPVDGPPGRQFGAGNPLNPALPTSQNVGQNLLPRTVNPMLMGEAATYMGTASTAGATGSGASGDRTVRGGLGGTGKGAPAQGRGVQIGSAPDDEARAARNAEKFGARTGRPGSSIMQPAAAGGRSADGEDDKEHVRRYGIDSGDVFDDERAVAPESIGDEPDDH